MSAEKVCVNLRDPRLILTQTRKSSDYRGEHMLMFLAPALALLLIQPAMGADKHIKLRVSETAGIRRFGYPVSVILPLAEPVKDVDHFRLLDGDKPVTAQFRPHGDTSKDIRAVILDFNASPAPLERREYVVEYRGEVTGSQAKNGLRVETTEKEFRIIHPSDLQFVVPRDLVGLLSQVQTKKLKFMDPESTGLILRTKTDEQRSIGSGAGLQRGAGEARLKTTSKVVKEGPLAVGLRSERVEDLGSLGRVPFTVEMEFPISKSWVRVVWSVDDSRGNIASLGVDLNLHVEGEPTLLDFGAGTSVYAQLKRDERALLRQNPKEQPAVWETFLGTHQGMKPFVIAPGSSGPSSSAEGWAHVMDRQRCTAIAVADFAKGQEGGEIMVYGHGRVRLWRHFGRPVKDVPRGPKKLTFWLHFVDMPVHVGAATSPQAMLAPLQVEVKDKP
jgi:hypothetical protein